jgi:hypothetical protein
LGKWYESEGKSVFGATASFPKLGEPHRKVHDSVHATIALLDQKWEHDVVIQDKIIAEMESAEAASLGVMQILDQMVKEKHQHIVKTA